MIECFFDGAVIPHNPSGHGGYGMIVRQDYQTIYSEAGYVGRWPALSSNVAEYAGCISVLRYLLKENIGEAKIYGDSLMVIKQLNSEWKARNGAYLPYYREAYALRARLPLVEMEWIPREMNHYADDLSKVGASKRVVGFKLDDSVLTVKTVLKKRKGKHKRLNRKFVFRESWIPEDEAWEMFKQKVGSVR